MEFSELINKYWFEIENNHEAPSYIKGIHEITYKQLSFEISQNNFIFIKKIIKLLYDGYVVIVRSAYSKEEVEYVKKFALNFSKNNNQNFTKVIEGCPDIHRVADSDIARTSGYSFYRVQHMYYFYRWNIENRSIFNLIDRTWDLFKILCGWNRDDYKNTTPKDGLVDRLHIHFYPSGSGEQELHQDPYKAQKIIMGHLFSVKGVGKEYETGGIYYINNKNEKIDIDSMLDLGDAYLSFPLLMHGVECIDSKKINNDNLNGRWFMGFYTLYSDHVLNRHTGWAVDNKTLYEKRN